MSEKPENPPAFPKLKRLKSESLAGYGFTAESTDSMTLRDYFAGQALAGISSSHELLEAIRRAYPQAQEGNPLVAEYCYALADAMLAARGKP